MTEETPSAVSLERSTSTPLRRRERYPLPNPRGSSRSPHGSRRETPEHMPERVWGVDRYREDQMGLAEIGRAGWQSRETRGSNALNWASRRLATRRRLG